MRQYVIRRPCAAWIEDTPLLPSLTVYEVGGEATDSGLLDARGNKLYVLAAREPIGFTRLKDEN